MEGNSRSTGNQYAIMMKRHLQEGRDPLSTHRKDLRNRICTHILFGNIGASSLNQAPCWPTVLALFPKCSM